MKASSLMAIMVGLTALSLPACHRLHGGKEEAHAEHQKIIVTTPASQDVTISLPYVCQIHSQRHIEVKALQEGYLEAIPVKEGQAVAKDEVLFRILPPVYKTRWDAEQAKARVAYIEYINTQQLNKGERPVVSQQEVAIYEARWKEAQARAAQAEVEYNFTFVKAPFAGIVDRQLRQQGTLVKKDEVLTTLSDNSTMWVYFNVPEARYLEYERAFKKQNEQRGGLSIPVPADHGPKTPEDKSKQSSRLELVDSRIELMLADGTKFDQDPGNTITVEGTFNNETGNIAFRADFPNPDGLLRHGQTGNIVIHRTVHKALVIPQRATFELLDKRYVYVIGEDHVAHQRLITIQHELEDRFVIESGLDVNDKIVLEGVREVHDGEKVEEFETRTPEEALGSQKFHAE